jgi:hypothetical protein
MSVAKTSVAKTSVAKAPDEVVGLGPLGGADRPVVGVAGLVVEAAPAGLGVGVAQLGVEVVGVGVAGLSVEAAELGASKLLTARNQTRRPVLAASGLERSLMMSRYQPMRPIVAVIRRYQPMRPIVAVIRLHRLPYPRIRFV